MLDHVDSSKGIGLRLLRVMIITPWSLIMLDYFEMLGISDWIRNLKLIKYIYNYTKLKIIYYM